MMESSLVLGQRKAKRRLGLGGTCWSYAGLQVAVKEFVWGVRP